MNIEHKIFHKYLEGLGYCYVGKDDEGYNFADPGSGLYNYQCNGFTFRYSDFGIEMDVSFIYGSEILASHTLRHKDCKALLVVLEAIADPSKAPLCVSIDWAKKLMEKLLIGREHDS